MDFPILINNPLMERSVGEEIEENKACNPCSYCWPFVDFSEPFLWVVGALSLTAMIVAAAQKDYFPMAMFSLAFLNSVLSLWRVRFLAMAKQLDDSLNEMREQVEDMETQAEELKKTNEFMEAQVYMFSSENDELREMVGLVGEKVGDVNKAAAKLLNLYRKYKLQNRRYELNNLMSLFLAVDRDGDWRLNKDELDRILAYVMQMYGLEIDREHLEVADDGSVAMLSFTNAYWLTQKKALGIKEVEV